MQPTETVWTTSVEKQKGINPVKFGQIFMSGLKREVEWKSLPTQAQTDDGQRLSQ